jgi:hypothetical protein
LPTLDFYQLVEQAELVTWTWEMEEVAAATKANDEETQAQVTGWIPRSHQAIRPRVPTF